MRHVENGAAFEKPQRGHFQFTGVGVLPFSFRPFFGEGAAGAGAGCVFSRSGGGRAELHTRHTVKLAEFDNEHSSHSHCTQQNKNGCKHRHAHNTRQQQHTTCESTQKRVFCTNGHNRTTEKTQRHSLLWRSKKHETTQARPCLAVPAHSICALAALLLFSVFSGCEASCYPNLLQVHNVVRKKATQSELEQKSDRTGKFGMCSCGTVNSNATHLRLDSTDHRFVCRLCPRAIINTNELKQRHASIPCRNPALPVVRAFFAFHATLASKCKI